MTLLPTSTAAGLLYYGQGFLIYPSGFPQGSRQTVATPMEYNMIYHDVTLETPDNVRIRAYLMLQREDVPNTKGAYQQTHIYWKSKRKEEGKQLRTTGGTSGSGNSAAKAEKETDADVAEGSAEGIRIDPEMSEHDQEIALSRPTVMIFHANAGNLGHRLPLARLFYDQMRCNVFILSYRGYGLSEGSPSEKGLRIDAQTALDFVREHPLLNEAPLLFYGQSIGGAVAIDLASRNPDAVHALIVENTFTSIPDLIPTVMPYLSSVSFLCHQVWPSSTSIAKIPPSKPVLMISGLQDEVVPPSHMKKLWEIVCSQGGMEGVEEQEILPEDGEEVGGKLGERRAERKEGAAESKGVEDNVEKSKDRASNREWRKVRRGVKWWLEFNEGQHNNTCIYREYWREVSAFVKQYTSITSS
ncbi:hypothetical protein FRC05_001506 [Tulasnella sp. 425]|nr:hypothetical protein FRC05_001506 [Tulasnella sp. 425]